MIKMIPNLVPVTFFIFLSVLVIGGKNSSLLMPKFVVQYISIDRQYGLLQILTN